MKGKIFLLFTALALSACGKQTTPEERLAEQKARVEMVQAQMHSCDKNDGIADIYQTSCYKGHCGYTKVVCADGMSKEFPN